MKISVLGCGRWGSFIAWYLSRKGNEVVSWGPEDDYSYKVLKETGKNEYVSLDEKITLSCDLEFAVTSAVFVKFDKKPSKEEIIKAWAEYKGEPQLLELPSAPKQFLNYFEEDNRPQAKLDRDLEGGMAVSIGRLREDTLFDYKFVCLSHNTLRGAAGGGVLVAELLAAKGYFD